MATHISRRDLLQVLAAAPAAVALGGASVLAQTPLRRPLHVGLVSRHVQWTTLEDSIALAKQIGFDAIEWNVRSGGHIDPARVERDLPRAVELTRQAGLAVTMITTSIQDAKSPHAEAILRAMQALGIRYYRGGQYFRYDYTRGNLQQQLEELKPRVASIAALNARYGTTIAYHTHSGAGNIGGNIWDIWSVIKDFDPRVVGLNYDIGHATARGGNGWIDAAHVVRDHISALAIKDVVWEHSAAGAWRTEFVPVGQGMIDLKRMFELLKAGNFAGPINIHYEHHNLLGTDLGTWKLDMPRDQFVSVVKADLDAVRARMRDAQVA